MDSTLRELLQEQRKELEKQSKDILPPNTYLSRLSPLSTKRRRPSTAKANVELDSPTSLLRPASVPLTQASDVNSIAPLANNGADGPPAVEQKATLSLYQSLEQSLELLEATEDVSTRCQELLDKIAAKSKKFGNRSKANSVSPSRRNSGVEQVLSSPTHGGDDFNHRMRLLFSKLKVISRAPELYRDMVESKEAVEHLYRFAIECSDSTLSRESLVGKIVKSVKEYAAAASCIFVPHSNNDSESDTDLLSRTSSYLAASERITMPVRTDNNIFGHIELTYGDEFPLPEKRSAKDRLLSLLDGLSSVASLSMQNNTSFLAAEEHRKRAEAMLAMAKQLAMDNLDEDILVKSIMDSARTLTCSERCRLFIVSGSQLTAFIEDGSKVSIDIYTGAEGEVARTGNIVNITDTSNDERFNPQIDRVTGTVTKTMICLPVQYEGSIVAVAQLINKKKGNSEEVIAFSEDDVELFNTFATFIGVSLRNCRLYQKLHDEKRKSEAILDVVQQLSNSDIRDVQSVVRHVMKGAKSLLNADRATLFLVDKERNQLYSTIADSTAGKEIRIPIGAGIAGAVAEKKVGENILDAYADPRFNRQVDIQMGYMTRSMLTEPIIFQDEILAVAQLVNKIDNHGEVATFTAEDKETFKAFSLFAGISISNSHLLEFAINAGREAMNLHSIQHGAPGRKQSIKITNDITEAMVQRVMGLDVPQDIMENIMFKDFNLFELRERYDEHGKDYAAKVLAEVILNTGLPQRFGCPPETLFRFILACRAKYRSVPYHNFFHAVDVCQTVWTFINDGQLRHILSDLQAYVMMITAIVHDLDHMGLNNSFHLKTDSPLGMLSSASGNNSVLEVHHCNLAINILEDPAKNVFIGLDPEESKAAFKLLIECVLATDMARHKEICTQFESLVTRGVSEHSDEDDKKLVMMMLTKAADISNVTKPFEISRLWGMCVTEEFYQQGDKERARGVDVAPMFDRTQNNELANGQIGFIRFIADPFFSLIAKALPGMKWCCDNIEENCEIWTRTLAGRRMSSMAPKDRSLNGSHSEAPGVK